VIGRRQGRGGPQGALAPRTAPGPLTALRATLLAVLVAVLGLLLLASLDATAHLPGWARGVACLTWLALVARTALRGRRQQLATDPALVALLHTANPTDAYNARGA